jgi:hypothetical protein
MSFLANPVSEHEVRHQKYMEDFKSFVKQQSQPLQRPTEAYAKPREAEYVPSFPVKYDRGQQPETVQRAHPPSDTSPGRAVRKKHAYEEPAEEYYPFGKPGAGAPLKNHATMSVPARQFDPSPQRTLNKSPSIEAPRQTVNYETQRRQEKEEQQRAYRELLNDQMQAKQRREANEKLRKQQEEQIEEARVRKQLEEIEEERRREESRNAPKPHIEPEYHPPEPPRNKRQRAASPTQRRDVPKYPSPQYLEPAAPAYASQPRPHHEKFRLSNDTSAQQAALQSMMKQMKAGAEAAKRDNIEAIMEFDQLRLGLKMKGDSYRAYESPVAAASIRQLEPIRKWQQSESKFIPLRQAGASVLKPAQSTAEGSQDYFELSNQMAKEQLARLDEMLKYQLRTQEPQDWKDDQRPEEIEDLGAITSYMAEEY